MKTVKKIIDVPEEMTKDLKIIAAMADTDVKNYIQDLVIEAVNKHRAKAKK